jgi:hypothetical protein
MQWRRAAYSGINATSAVFALWHVLPYTLVGGGQQRQHCASCGNMLSSQECDCVTVLQALVHCSPTDCYYRAVVQRLTQMQRKSGSRWVLAGHTAERRTTTV